MATPLTQITTLLRQREEVAMARLAADIDAVARHQAHLDQTSRRACADMAGQMAHHATGAAMQWQLYLAAQRDALHQKLTALTQQQDARQAQLKEAVGRDLALRELEARKTQAQAKRRAMTQADDLDHLTLMREAQRRAAT